MTSSPADKCAFHPDRDAWVRCTRCDRPICGDCVIPATVGQHCPACVKQSRTRVRTLMPNRKYSAVYVIMGLTVATFVIDQVTRGALTERGLSQSWLILVENQWWRLLTPALLHAGIIHIALNMYALYVLGPVLEEGQGTARFLTVYIVSALTASAASVAVPVFLNPARVVPVRTAAGVFVVPGGSVGASGAVFGLFGALALLLWRRRQAAAARAQLTQIAVLIALNLVIGFSIHGIDNYAHIGGMIGGAIVALGFDLADLRARFAKLSWLGAAVALALAVVVLAVARVRLGAYL